VPRPSSPTASTPAIPWWVSALDAACIVLLAYAAVALFGHRIRFAIGPLYVSLTSWWRLLFWTAVVIGIRHALWRGVSWHAHVAASFRRFVGDPAVRAAWPAFLLSRVAALSVGYMAVVTIGFDPPRPWRALDNTFLDLFARWDAGWYGTIANIGYDAGPNFNPARASSIAFFPGLPMLMRAARHLLNVNLWIGAIILVLTAFFFALVYLYRLAREDMPADQARAALLFLAFYPFSVCYSAVLTESLFLLAASASFFYFRRGRLARTALFGLLAGIVRPNGFLLSVPLGLLALIPFARARGWLPGGAGPDEGGWRRLAARLGVAAAPIVSVAGYSAFVYSRTGDPFAWARAQQAWGRQPGLIFEVFSQRSDLIAASGISAYPGQYPIEMLEMAAVVFALAGLWPIVKRFGLAYGVFVLMAIVPPLFTMGSISLGRYTAPLFPLFLWLGAAVPERRRPYWLALFAAGQALIATLFYTWRPPY
jgi:Mannosyltransferase (PIG-V)